MATRIRNITDHEIEVPLLGARIMPGDVATVPDTLADVVFPENYFEVDGPNDGGVTITEINAGDSANSVEGVDN